MACLIKGITEALKDLGISKALEKGLFSRKISKRDATEVERKLQGEQIKNWKETFDKVSFNKVKEENLLNLLDHLEKSYEGITKEVRKKMDGILFCDKFEDGFVDNTFVSGSASTALYCLFAFCRSSDGKLIDCIYVIYKAEFELAPEEIESSKDHSLLFGLFKWESYSTEEKIRKFGIETNKKFENYFRMKVQEELKKKNVIERVTYEG